MVGPLAEQDGARSGLGERRARARAGAEERSGAGRTAGIGTEAMRDGVFQSGQERQLLGQPPERLTAGHDRRT